MRYAIVWAKTLRTPWLLALITMCGISTALAQEGLAGDVNLDGAINVLDVQASINMALGVADGTTEADVDENAAVDVLDVQTITNTAIGTGGLLQEVTGLLQAGAFDAGEALRVIAISNDGRQASGVVDPETGAFSIDLPVRTAWSLAFLQEGPEPAQTAGTVSFPLAGGVSTTLPLPNLSTGEPLDIGTVEALLGAAILQDVRALLAEAAEPLDDSDSDGDGLADVIESLVLPLPLGLPDFGLVLPGFDFSEDVLTELAAACIQDSLAVPSLVGVETEGIPQFIAPLFTCLEENLTGWLDDVGLPDQFADFFSQVLMAALLPRTDDWLEDLGVPDVQDTDGNGVPDFIQDEVCIPEGAPANLEGLGVCTVDGMRDGVPDFAQDDDGDGTPNLLDSDAHGGDDLDGDGVPNAFDIDQDGDGVPNYADAAPEDPAVS